MQGVADAQSNLGYMHRAGEGGASATPCTATPCTVERVWGEITLRSSIRSSSSAAIFLVSAAISRSAPASVATHDREAQAVCGRAAAGAAPANAGCDSKQLVAADPAEKMAARRLMPRRAGGGLKAAAVATSSPTASALQLRIGPTKIVQFDAFFAIESRVKTPNHELHACSVPSAETLHWRRTKSSTP